MNMEFVTEQSLQNEVRNQAVFGYRKRQRGATLLEGIAFLGIAAFVILGAVWLLSSAFGGAQSSRALEEVVALRTGVQKVYTGQTYEADMVGSLITAKAIPGTLKQDSNSGVIQNTWAGTVAIGSDDSGASFKITYPNVPQDVCFNVVTGASGWTDISDGSTTITSFPVTASSAQSVCGNTSNTLIFHAS
jgi:type II secretory pathway pseudopilin PulG